MSVPKIIHQLWIGPKSIPINAMNTIKQDNPDYEYILWNEERLEGLTIPKKYKQKIKLMEELNGKADMYRWIILEKYGGVFVDADMISIAPIDDFIINAGPFFCWENEIVRNGLCATTIMGFTKEHIIPKLAIQWIMNNRITSPAWISVGPQLLTNIYNSLPDKNVVNVLPSYTFLPDHHSGMKYKGHGKVYMTHEWGSTRNNYNSINTMNVPIHHTEPKDILNITIPDDINTRKLKEMIQGIKNIQGHFGINLSTHLDISKYLNSTRFIYVNGNIPEQKEELIFYNERGHRFDHNEFETTEQRLCEKYIQPEDIVLELGARYGTISCLTNKIISNKKQHYVVEPDKAVWNALEKNMEINQCDFNILKGVIGEKNYKLSGHGYAKQSIETEDGDIETFKIPDAPFNTLIADCEGYLETFYNENKQWFHNLNKIIYECDMPQNCDYDYLLNEFKNIGFEVQEKVREFDLDFFVLIKKK